MCDALEAHLMESTIQADGCLPVETLVTTVKGA